TYQTADAGWVNHELQTYVNTKSPKGTKVAESSDGTLKIHTFREGDKIYSARLYGNKSQGFKYGYIEARIKLPKGKGTWPAWWMMPVSGGGWPGCGEIDIMEEVGVDANIVSSSIHCTAYNHPTKTQKTHSMTCAGAEDGFHIYALEWTEDYIRTFVDGTEQLYFENDHQGNNDTWPFDKAFYPILNVAWGGDWGGYAGVDESALPVTMEVDYVRVWQKR
ncbi:MAG: glycoside hydrolase family 16 protein, partial [Bacteroidaceae bacterium]|nr:glycoside hydrolase family 16 protein [Bacteroidaceae bacterium]